MLERIPQPQTLETTYPFTPYEEPFRNLLRDLARARTLTDVNIAAGIALQTLEENLDLYDGD